MMNRNWLSLVGVAAVAAGCSNSGNGGNDKEPDVPTPGADSLERNPTRSLVCENPGVASLGATPMARLTNAEYFNSLRDLVSPLDLEVADNLPIEKGFNGSFSNNHVDQTPSRPLIDAFEDTATSVGTAVAAGLDRLGISDCPPRNNEDACRDSFVTAFGERAYRRPLTADERTRLVGFFDAARDRWGFSKAIELTTNALVQSPQFVYKLEFGNDDGTDAWRLTGYEVASRLSYLLWDTMPDAELFSAAESGDLDSMRGIEAQAKRLLGDERAGVAMRRFVGEWLDFQRLNGTADSGAKDPELFPNYTKATSDAVHRGMDLFVEDALVGEGGGLKKLLTSNRAWVNQSSAAVYDVKAANGDTLSPVSLDASQRKGLLTQAGFLGGLAHARVHSSIFRGVFVLNRFLCMPPPSPPANVNTDVPEITAEAKTARQRVEVVHQAQGSACKGCHRQIDGIGFAFEHYNAVGSWQDTDNGEPVDSSSFIEGSLDADGEYDGAIGMIDALAKSEQVKQCFVEQWYRYALARLDTDADGCSIAAMTDEQVETDGDFGRLVSAILKTQDFRFRKPFEK
jgi:Protein of unknown function (DUF1592)/Protein of unknown function (DUF1588)/Protein of unknown function (DUF1595)/Protein of unknown function (DUF1585)/Protein of unknown function (DUF1587)